MEISLYHIFVGVQLLDFFIRAQLGSKHSLICDGDMYYFNVDIVCHGRSISQDDTMVDYVNFEAGHVAVTKYRLICDSDVHCFSVHIVYQVGM